MKKFDVDGLDYSLFDFSAAKSSRDLAHAKSGVTTPATFTNKTWRVEFAQPEKSARPYRDFGKRALDILLVLISLPLTLPVIVLCAAVLWIESGAPIYTQKRLGLKGKAFSIFKLRTMVQNADAVLEDYLAQDSAMRAEWDSLQKIINDPRITRFGSFLRATSLDELPQLFNVLKGDMSLVGPRPMMPEQEEIYGDMRAYAAVRPGITGLWQVSARNGNTFAYRNESDAEYERDLSFVNDLRILVKTVGVVLRGTGH